jgi:hypothetical protein
MPRSVRLALFALVAVVVSSLFHEFGHCAFYWLQGIPAAMSLTKEFPLRDITATQYAIGSAGGPLASIALVVLATLAYRKYSANQTLKDLSSAFLLANVFYLVLRGLIALLKRRGGELSDAASLLAMDYRALVVIFFVVAAVCLYVWMRWGGPRVTPLNAVYFIGFLVGYVILVTTLESVDSNLLWNRFPTIRIDDGRVYNAGTRQAPGEEATRNVEKAPQQEQPLGLVELSSSYDALDAGFDWAKAQALVYVFEGDPVGKWYEAALPGREAFCMRDVSHQALGALALGLAEHTKNMMRKFAENIAESRDWCSYWEINRYDAPAPVDYRSDEDFWYNLPANFDVIQSCYRVYEWTGDEDYLNDPVLRAFYRHSLTDYVSAWDSDGDGIMESAESNGYRGIPTYWEGWGPRALTGGDLVAAQFAANLAYANMLSLRGEAAEAGAFGREAERLRRFYNDAWWNAELGRFYTAIVQDGRFDTTHIPLLQIMPLYFGIVEPGARRESLVGNLAAGAIVEVNAYLPEVYYQNGRNEEAFLHLMAQLDPGLQRREYPEVSFTAIGVIARYLMGINPIASQSVIETKPGLPEDVTWARIEHVPALRNTVSVHHVGWTETRFVNESGEAVRWRAILPGSHDMLDVDGRRTAATTRYTEWGAAESHVLIEVEAGEERTVRAVDLGG